MTDPGSTWLIGWIAVAFIAGLLIGARVRWATGKETDYD